jgi:hypothetical protein
MAAADYRSCDVCSRKTFYDAHLSWNRPDAAHQEWWLHGVGDWAVICIECAKTHEVVVKLKDTAERSIARIITNNWKGMS